MSIVGFKDVPHRVLRLSRGPIVVVELPLRWWGRAAADALFAATGPSL